MSSEDAVLPVESTQPDRHIWGPWATVGFGLAIGIVFIIAQGLVAVAFGIQKYLSEPALNPSQLIEILISDGLLISLAVFASSIVCTGLTIVFVKIRGRASIAEYLGLKPITKKRILILLAITAGLVALSSAIDLIIEEPVNPDYMLSAYNTSIWPVLFWIAVVIFGPAFEEIFFRGFLFEGFRQSRLGIPGTVVLTALMWALLHVQYDIYGMSIIFVFGIVLGIVRYKTNSLFSTVLMHVFWNMVAMIELALYAKGIIS